jgi:eukaryotic-like serine/threonine-protein kinase
MKSGDTCPSCGAALVPGAVATPICVRCAMSFALDDLSEDFPLEMEPDDPGASAVSAPRERIGSYLLRKVLGEGGMGIVWEAEQEEPVRRRVALKRLRLGLDGAQILARFESERQALALMSHPNIARALDAGCTPEGHPYFAMEIVDGPWITRYCDAQRLDIRRRLELFLEVCRGIQHAHQRGVIHRDIKPSNILIQTEEGRPVPKIIDFGVAKAMGAQLTDRTLVTRIGQTVGTPEYMSPEQAGPAGFDVDTRTDVYALGIVLYELLTGRLPFEAEDGDLDELRRRIREEEPVRPSTRVAPTQPGVLEIAHARGVEPAALARSLRGDLDWIVLKALAKDRDHRYGTPDELAADIGRYLANEPVLAGPPSAAYRVRKFVRRNRGTVALTTAVLIALVAGMVGTLIEARAARAQRDFALRQWSRAEAIADLDEFIATESDPPSGETLDLAERLLGLRQGANPANRVEILIQLSGRSTIEKGDARMRRMAEEAYQLSRGIPDPSPRAKAACALGSALAIGAVSSDKSLLPRAEALIQEGLGELPEDPQFALDRAFCLQYGAYVSRTRGAGSESITRLRQAQEALKQAPSHSEQFELLIAQGLADSLRTEGRNREACTAYEQLFARLTVLGREDTSLARMTHYKWGTSLYLLGRPQEAEKQFHRTIEGFSGSEDAPDVIPWQLLSHARAVRDLGQLEKAAAEAEHAYSVAMKDEESSFANQALLLRASIDRLLGDLDHAQSMLAEVEPRLRSSLPPGDVAFASLLSEQALLAQARGDAGAGLRLIDQSLSIAEASAKASHKQAELVPAFLIYRSDMKRQLGRADDAVADATRARTLIQEAMQPGAFSSNLGHACLALGQALQAQGKPDEARAAFRTAVENLQDALGPDHPDTRGTRLLADSGAGSQ